MKALVIDEFHKVSNWISIRVEQDGTDDYLMGYKTIYMKGISVCVREAR